MALRAGGLAWDHVIICELAPQRADIERCSVLSDMFSGADCAAAVLELTPSKRFGADVERLTKYFAARGVESKREPSPQPPDVGAMIRYPVQGQCQLRVRTAHPNENAQKREDS
ncbi:hypothetical protein Rhe02_60880 [Rhizocola hellebori]|uniref:Uncharacterized protein n=1 Tax=Rhizocola hellebori TaxID=1392758 RepID=A0A8J3VJF9_9ACTN|nr:hypothetical protein Rhe02_60880 [Rhizocola hellebori]